VDCEPLVTTAEASGEQMTNSQAWAVIASGVIDVDSLASSRRWSIGSWLIIRHGVGGVNFATDDHIEKLWKEYGRDAVVEEVKVERHGAGK
jgi:hypothetical protein